MLIFLCDIYQICGKTAQPEGKVSYFHDDNEQQAQFVNAWEDSNDIVLLCLPAKILRFKAADDVQLVLQALRTVRSS